jgi:hypothetical protein
VAQTSTGDGAIVPPLIVLIIFVFVLLSMLRRGRHLPYVMRHGGGFMGPGGSFGGGSSSGGGFSGGGGSFGGGGASGSW